MHLVVRLFLAQVERCAYARRSVPLGGVPAACAALIVLSLCAFGLTTAFRAALVLYWGNQVLRSISEPLQDAWLNERIDDAHVGATVFSVSSQVDAVGQISGGPLVGLIGSALSIRAALVISGLMLSPVLPLYALARRLLVRRVGSSTEGDEQPA